MTVIIPDPPGGNDFELNVLRKQTKRYIDASPSVLTLQRGTRVPDGAGGHRTTRAGLPIEQTVRIIQQALTHASVERRNSDGEVVRPTLVMMTEWDADVEDGDQFVWNDYKCEVVYIQDLKYELICEVAVR